GDVEAGWQVDVGDRGVARDRGGDCNRLADDEAGLKINGGFDA
ncbi:MAG: hypothetical protein JWN40_1403, partial [Phycisphaerales bacterium]|nr:hypothetical protein [Phycisphaerales bacterium]